MNIATKIDKYIDSIDLTSLEKDSLNKSKEISQKNLENCINDIYKFCWQLLEEYINEMYPGNTKYKSTIYAVEQIRKPLRDEILRDFYIKNGGFTSRFVSSNSLETAMNNSGIFHSVDYRTLRKYFDDLDIANPGLYQKLISYHLIQEPEKAEKKDKAENAKNISNHIKFNKEFPRELYFLQANPDFYSNVSAFMKQPLDISVFTNGLQALTDLASNTDHQQLLLHYLCRQYKLDFYIFSIHHLKDYIELLSRLKDSPNLSYTEKGESPNTPLSQSRSYLHDILATRIAYTLPLSFLSYSSSRQFLLDCYYNQPFHIYKIEFRAFKEFPCLDIVDYGFLEYFIKNSFLYALEILKDRLPIELSKYPETFTQKNKTNKIPGLLEGYFDLQNKMKDLPYNADMLLKTLSARTPSHSLCKSTELLYKIENLQELLSDGYLHSLYEFLSDENMREYRSCIYAKVKEYMQ